MRVGHSNPSHDGADGEHQCNLRVEPLEKCLPCPLKHFTLATLQVGELVPCGIALATFDLCDELVHHREFVVMRFAQMLAAERGVVSDAVLGSERQGQAEQAAAGDIVKNRTSLSTFSIVI